MMVTMVLAVRFAVATARMKLCATGLLVGVMMVVLLDGRA